MTPKEKERATRAALGPRIGIAPKGAAAKRYSEYYGTRAGHRRRIPGARDGGDNNR